MDNVNVGLILEFGSIWHHQGAGECSVVSRIAASARHRGSAICVMYGLSYTRYHRPEDRYGTSAGCPWGDGDAEEDLQPAGDEQEHGDDRSGSGMFLASGVRSEGVVATPGVL